MADKNPKPWPRDDDLDAQDSNLDFTVYLPNAQGTDTDVGPDEFSPVFPADVDFPIDEDFPDEVEGGYLAVELPPASFEEALGEIPVADDPQPNVDDGIAFVEGTERPYPNLSDPSASYGPSVGPGDEEGGHPSVELPPASFEKALGENPVAEDPQPHVDDGLAYAEGSERPYPNLSDPSASYGPSAGPKPFQHPDTIAGTSSHTRKFLIFSATFSILSAGSAIIDRSIA